MRPERIVHEKQHLKAHHLFSVRSLTGKEDEGRVQTLFLQRIARGLSRYFHWQLSSSEVCSLGIIGLELLYEVNLTVKYIPRDNMEYNLWNYVKSYTATYSDLALEDFPRPLSYHMNSEITVRQLERE